MPGSDTEIKTPARELRRIAYAIDDGHGSEILNQEGMSNKLQLWADQFEDLAGENVALRHRLNTTRPIISKGESLPVTGPIRPLIHILRRRGEHVEADALIAGFRSFQHTMQILHQEIKDI